MSAGCPSSTLHAVWSSASTASGEQHTGWMAALVLNLFMISTGIRQEPKAIT